MSPRVLLVSLALGAAALATLASACGEGKNPPPSRRSPETANGADTSGPRKVGEVQIISSSSGGGSHIYIDAAQVNSTTSSATSAGLTVRGSASSEIVADGARVMLLIQSRSGQPQPIDAKDRAAAEAAIVALGFKKEDLFTNSDFRFGPFTTIEVAVPVKDVKAKGDQVVSALEKVFGRSDSRGVRFLLKHCDQSLAPLRKSAFEAAQTKARAIAAAGSFSLGPVVALSEAQSQLNYGGPQEDPCDQSGASIAGKGGPQGLLAFDAEPRVRASASLTVTYALGAQADGQGLTVVGTGSVKARADEAYLIALLEPSFGPSGPRPLDPKDQAALLVRLKALGIDAKDVRVTSPGFGGPTLISVELPIASLGARGFEVVDAIEKTVGRISNRGVQFSHSQCETVVGEAHKGAIADAKARAQAIAEATGLKVGSLRGISESALVNPYGPPLVDPCSEDLATFYAYNGVARLKGFDAEPEFDADIALAVSFALN